MKKVCLSVIVAWTAVVVQAGHFNGGRTVPVHRLAPVDRNGDKVNVAEPFPMAISQTKTCAQCHDVAKMAGGSHFRCPSSTNNVARTCNFEPWFLVNKDGTVKNFACALESGLTAFEFVKTFARAFPGGGLGDDPKCLEEEGGARSRWFVTGPLEMNCLACHMQGEGYDPSEYAKQTLRENFSGAALAAAGIARVEGMNERLDASWDKLHRENPDDHLFRVPEKIVYDKNQFDDKGRCVFRVGRPENARCLACHEVAQAGLLARKMSDDVHVQRGMKCIDCHTSGMSHRLETKTCGDCHLASKGAGPKPTHTGLPLVHFKKLRCAVCHSGVTEGGKLAQVRTARANRIGIYGKAQWATDVPFILEPVFVKNEAGVVEARRMTWLAENQEPVSWRFAHNVRPARQARGAAPNKCADCHVTDSPFFFGKVTPVYPTADGKGKLGTPVCQTKFLSADGIYHWSFGAMFMGRPFFKVFLWTIFAILCLFTAAVAALALKRVCEKVDFATDSFCWGLFKWIVDAGFVVSVVYLVLSGVIGWIGFGGMSWWFLVLHMVAGGAFAAAIVLMAIFRTSVRVHCACSAFVWMLWITLGACVVFTAVMPMMTVFGSHGQEILLWAHRCTALTFALVSAWVCACAIHRKR